MERSGCSGPRRSAWRWCWPQRVCRAFIMRWTSTGEAHWDGGYAANPPLIPLVGASRASEVLLVQLVPTDHAGVPVTKSEIDKRLGQIKFNGPLQKELEAI